MKSAILLAILAISFTRQISPALSPLLTIYYELKDDLVKADAVAAAAKAGQLETALNNITVSSLSKEDSTAFAAAAPKLKEDARHLAATKDLEKQRDLFAGLSTDMFSLAKSTSLSTQPVYQEYCPMKKAYWLSSESAIKNPYFGSQMLTCGKVTETLP